jgi:protein-serine/threonine kinase
VNPSNPKEIQLKVIKTYQFEAGNEKELKKVIEIFKDLKKNGEKKKKIGVSIEDFEFIKILGKGSFSKVCLVKHKESEKYLAMKCLNKSELKKRNQIEHTNTERSILSTFTHPFIVKMYASFQTSDKLYMCLEFVNGGEMFHHLKKARRFPDELVCFYAAEVLLALEFLHNNGNSFPVKTPLQTLFTEI